MDSRSEMPPALKSVKDNFNQNYAVGLTSDYHVLCVGHIDNRAVVDASALIQSKVEKL